MPFKNILYAALLVLLGTAQPAVTQASSPLGRTIIANDNTYLFRNPPGGLGGRAAPMGVLGVNKDGTASYYAMAPKAGSANSFTLEEPIILPNATATVTDYRDVVQGKQVKRWLKVQTRDGTGRQGWVLWGNRNAKNSTLEWVN